VAPSAGVWSVSAAGCAAEAASAWWTVSAGRTVSGEVVIVLLVVQQDGPAH
jgi:hypothetical protein